MVFRNSKRIHSIHRVHHYEKDVSIKFLINRIHLIEKQIAETNRAIFEAQSVKIRSFFTQEKNFLTGLQKKLVESNANKSIKWHLDKLLELRKQKRFLQERLDRLTGKFWSKKISSLFIAFSIVIIFLLSLITLIVGIFTAIYLLPIIGLIVIASVIFNQIKPRFNRF